MTGFCGVLIRQQGSSAVSEELSRKIEIARKNLSRRPEDVVYLAHDECGFVAYFDNGAFEANRTLHDDGETITCVSGDPLIVDADDVSNNPAASVAALLAALANNDSRVIASTAGSFVAARWNRKTRTLNLCADKLALRPLYVYLDANECVFATSIRVLRQLCGRPLEIDEQGLAELIYFGQSLGNRTIHKNVRVLKPCELLTINSAHEESSRYFDWNSVVPIEASEADLCSALYQAFIEAIRRRSRRKVEDAFLSGGLDSRCVVAGLLDIGRDVRTFGACYPNSADDVISRIVAKAFGTRHTAHHSDPVERQKGAIDNFALQARQYFPQEPAEETGSARIIWSGDGGSVGMGHVYLSKKAVELAAGDLSEAALCKIFSGFDRRRTRLIGTVDLLRLRKLALCGIRSELESIAPKRRDRRLFLFYLLNDQMRHMYTHLEDIDISFTELETPFFDADFLSLVVASPTAPFLRHGLYNRWLTTFTASAASLPWQTYPGHLAGPHRMPSSIVSQWSGSWYSGPRIRRLAERIASQILASKDARVTKYVSQSAVAGLRVLNRLGIERYNYELWLARRIYHAITGEAVTERR